MAEDRVCRHHVEIKVRDGEIEKIWLAFELHFIATGLEGDLALFAAIDLLWLDALKEGYGLGSSAKVVS